MGISDLHWVINGLLAIIMMFMKAAIGDIKDKLVKQDEALERVKENYTKKEDYMSFKTELWSRLDEMKADFLRALDKK